MIGKLEKGRSMTSVVEIWFPMHGEPTEASVQEGRVRKLASNGPSKTKSMDGFYVISEAKIRHGFTTSLLVKQPNIKYRCLQVTLLSVLHQVFKIIASRTEDCYLGTRDYFINKVKLKTNKSERKFWVPILELIIAIFINYLFNYYSTTADVRTLIFLRNDPLTVCNHM
ncbi:hypothetical protein AVEN_224740-1 [Araneus ventricosus]|uniref:Uncharacterized protein n=1 Tax=Araneus ventricosus TaxID=182803 RepID=A0A4Y2HXY3_ARAVE|nr:hypothetical protein AVEN_224740-1 [Araneus ventricosus]